MTPICDNCGYDLTGTERRDGLYRCPECGKFHDAVAPLEAPPWPGWRHVLLRASVPTVLVLGAMGVWLAFMPGVAHRNWRTGGFMIEGTVFVFPFVLLASAVWGPFRQARTFAASSRGPSPTKRRIVVVGMACNLALIVAVFFFLGGWAGLQLIRSMPD